MKNFSMASLFAGLCLCLPVSCIGTDENVGSQDIAAAPAVHCGGLAGLTCGEGQVCDYADDAMCGAADHLGDCVSCDSISGEVCGCDGTTYASACAAAQANASVDHAGACAAPASQCGGIAGLTCGEGQVCDYADDAMCGAADQLGDCVSCDSISGEVCGCDGTTYASACAAAEANASVDHAGACGGGAGKCGGITGLACGDGQVCDYADDAMCGAADQLGDCVSCDSLSGAVCACGGTTYPSACAAAQAGASVDHAGACETISSKCGGLSGQTCADGEICDYTGESCGIADQMGDCVACDTVSGPVCACDGLTYASACAANEAGASINYLGACPAPEACGGLAQIECPVNFVCDYPDGSFCGGDDSMGACVDPDTIAGQVCGCDGNTYDHAYLAADAGVSIDHAGPC